MITSRADIIGKPGFYLDRSATGTGKSTADVETARQVESMLIVAPTHENTSEIEKDMQAAKVDARKYPGRNTSGEETNCWNPTADFAEGLGLSVVSSVCSSCQERATCICVGYLSQIAATKGAKVAIATHQRGVFNGIDNLAGGRAFISMHEDASQVLCPDETVSLNDVRAAAVVLNLILNNPKYLDWLGQSASRDEDGKFVPDEKLAAQRTRIDTFVRHLADLIDSLIADSETVEKTRKANIPAPIKKPTGTDNLLLRATAEAEVSFSGPSWRVLLAAASGELYSIGWILDETPKGKKTVLVANWRNIPGDGAIVLFSDATTSREDMEMYIGRPVEDITPQGHVSRSKRVVQYPKDITRRTARNAFLAMLRAVMVRFPNARQVGIITHRTLTGHLPHIGDPFKPRIVKSTYFGSGQDRASNDWYGACDLIIVAGTPRVPTIMVQRRLIQFGDFVAAGENPDWGETFWRGQTESGQETTVSNRGYRHPLWMRAHRSLVRANLVQAVGRGRPILDAGCDVAVLSTEECGFPLADRAENPITETELNLLSVIGKLTLENLTSLEKLTSRELTLVCAKSISKRRQAIADRMSIKQAITTTAEIAQLTGLSSQRTRSILSDLESRGLVSRSGERGGWMLTEAGQSLRAAEIPAEIDAAPPPCIVESTSEDSIEGQASGLTGSDRVPSGPEPGGAPVDLFGGRPA